MRIQSIAFATLALLTVSSVTAQDTETYSKVVADLSSPRFHGRGYTNDGVRKAAGYIAERFRRAGVDTVMMQPFTLDINTFPERARLSVDGKRITAGTNFVMREYSPGVHGVFPLYYIDTTSYDSARVFRDLAKEENRNAMVVCDFWFTYRHRDDFRRLQTNGECDNAGLVLRWDTPLKFYKAYGERVADKPTIWVDGSFPKDASTIEADIDNRFLKGYECHNVIARVDGSRHDSCYVFTAHYDHLGHLGRRVYFPGANDNASGVASIVTLAGHYAAARPRFDVYFIAFAGEEAGLKGSSFLAGNSPFPLDRIRYLVNLDMVGDNAEAIHCQTSASGEDGFRMMESLNSTRHYFSSIIHDGLKADSDHFPFAERGVPCCMFISWNGDAFPFYHTASDTSRRTFTCTYESLYRLLVNLVDSGL